MHLVCAFIGTSTCGDVASVTYTIKIYSSLPHSRAFAYRNRDFQRVGNESKDVRINLYLFVLLSCFKLLKRNRGNILSNKAFLTWLETFENSYSLF